MTTTNKTQLQQEAEALQRMAHSPVRNYAIPGLISWLIGQPGPHGCVRLFECTRDHDEPIVPHSHRFDFTCRVLRGHVRNVVWVEEDPRNLPNSDLYQRSKLVYGAGPGRYERVERLDQRRFKKVQKVYADGDVYEMKAEQIHSIFFSRGALVQFLEGPTRRNDSIILEPVVDNEVIPTFRVEPWMFKKEWQS